ncbi:hypothetical protein [Streptomyces violascens]|nr:hypothetical protein [Streptomyces violascens]
MSALLSGCGGFEGPSTPAPTTPRATSTSSGNLAYERTRKAWGDTEWNIKQSFFSEGLTPSGADFWAPGQCSLRMSATYREDERAKLSRSLDNLVQDGWISDLKTPKNTQFTNGDMRLSVSTEHDVSEPGSPVQANAPLKYVFLDVTSISCASSADTSTARQP